MTNTLMRGASDVRRYIEDFLSVQMPKQILLARAQWGLEEWQLPIPLKYDSYDPLVTSVYPTVGSVVRRSTNWVRNDYSEYGEESYDAQYSVLIFLWCKTAEMPDGKWQTPGHESALKMRDDLIAILRSCLLGTPSLGSNGLARLNERSIVEDYFDSIKLSESNGRYAAGGSITVDITVTESASLTEVGFASTISTDAEIMSETGVTP